MFVAARLKICNGWFGANEIRNASIIEYLNYEFALPPSFEDDGRTVRKKFVNGKELEYGTEGWHRALIFENIDALEVKSGTKEEIENFGLFFGCFSNLEASFIICRVNSRSLKLYIFPQKLKEARSACLTLKRRLSFVSRILCFRPNLSLIPFEDASLEIFRIRDDYSGDIIYSGKSRPAVSDILSQYSKELAILILFVAIGSAAIFSQNFQNLLQGLVKVDDLGYKIIAAAIGVSVSLFVRITSDFLSPIRWESAK